MNKLPIITSLKSVEIKKIYGQSIFDYYQQVKRLFRSRPDASEIEAFFAEPSINKSRQEISWYTELEGDIKPVGSLDPATREAVSKKLSDYYSEIMRVSGEFSAVQGARSLGAEALKAMLVTPRISESLFLIGDKLVIAEWGCVPFGSLPEVYDLIVQDKKVFKSVLPAIILKNEIPSLSESEPVNADRSINDGEALENLGAKAVDAEIDTEEESHWSVPPKENVSRVRASNWIEFVKLFILIGLLSVLAYGCYTRTWFVTINKSNEETKKAESELNSEITELAKSVDEIIRGCKSDIGTQETNNLPSSDEVKKPDINDGSKYDSNPVEKSEGTNQQKADDFDNSPGIREGKSQTSEKESLLDEANPVPPDVLRSPADGFPSPPEAHPKGENVDKSNDDMPNGPADHGSSNFDAKVQKDAPAPVASNLINPNFKKEMKFSKNAKDLSFLDGCWKSSSEIFDVSTHTPVEIRYCFTGEKGVGTLEIKDVNGNKCSTPLSAVRKGKLLNMTYKSVQCSGGFYPPAKVVCHQENNVAACNHIEIFNGKDEPIDDQVTGARFIKIDSE